MIHPTLQVSEDIYIHAAREAVWARFCRVNDWPRWRSDVTKTTWRQGQAWQEGAQFALYTGDSVAQPTSYIIRMVVVADTSVWESSSLGQGVVYSINLIDQVGGCKVTLRCTFHGWGSLLKRLTRASEATKLHTFLSGLKGSVEQGGPRR